MPPQRGARALGATDNLQGNVALPYQNPQQSGRTCRPSTKALALLQPHGPFATLIQPATSGPSSERGSEQTQDTEMTSHALPHPPQPPESSNDRTSNEICISQTSDKVPASEKRIRDLSSSPTAQATPTPLRGDTPPPAPPAPPAPEAPFDLRQTPPSPGPPGPYPVTTLPTHSLSTALENTVRAAASRAAEGQQIYGPIATIWDNYLQSEDARKLPTRLRKPLIALCKEIAAVANKHFDAYIKGTRPSCPITSPATPASTTLSPPGGPNTLPSATNPQTSPTPTYAQAAGPNNLTETSSQAIKQARKPPQTKRDTQSRPDTRLFVRLGPGHKARSAGPFAVLSVIKNLLGNDSALLKEVQEVNSGFALCTDSIPALTALEKHSERIAQLLTDCIVERQPIWTTYYLSNIPRKVNTLGSHGQIVNSLVTDSLVSEAILDLTGQTPTRATETKESSHSELFETSWILSFDTATHKPLPRTVRILGASAMASLLKQKKKTVQCTKCYRWHNSRSCTRAQRCRICGSGNHLEVEHTTRCGTASPHTCPARCLHCGGPHPADDPKCLLRPTPKGLKTRAERKAIIEACKTTRTRACAAAECSIAPPITSQTDSLTNPHPTTPKTPTQILSQIVPTTPASVQHYTIEASNRGATHHELALSLANDSHIDIVLIQEPYILSDYSRQISKSHPSYETFSPLDDWSTRPRVMSYIRKGASLCATQLRPTTTRDTIFLQLQTRNSAPLTIINAYNAPPNSANAGETINTLLDLPNNILRTAFLAGDFNLHHARWDPYGPQTSTLADSFTSWLDRNSFALTAEPGVSTHERGNVLDLAFLSGCLTANTHVANHFQVTSDHKPLLTTIIWDTRNTIAPKRLRIDTLDEDVFTKLLSANCQALPRMSETPSTQEMDKAATSLTQAISNAFNGSAKRTLGQNSGYPWWNKNCKMAAQENRLHRSPATAKALRSTVRKAKKMYWESRLDSVTDSKDVFKMTRWHQTTGVYRSPPFADPQAPLSGLESSIEGKRNIIIKNLLTNTAEAGDISHETPTTAVRNIPFPLTTAQDIRHAILGAGNTAPGLDEIPTKILRIAWPLIEEHVLTLFRECLSNGHHPAPFRAALLAIIPKPNKADRTSPRSYRPIALLPVLGKGLERLVARKMSWLAITYRVTASQQFGALPLRSSVDLTTCLTHDIEEALNNGEKATLLTMDVKGAFDGVLPGRLVCRLREQGWPDNLVRWIRSFATNRSVRIRLDGETGPETAICHGLPQGSPISPILFMLYIAPLFWLGKPTRRFGYADDIALLSISPNLQTNCDNLQIDLQEALEWGESEGITFDPKKSELMHFSRSPTNKAPTKSLGVTLGSHSVEVTKGPLRWLGVYFDSKLSFKQHVQILSAKAHIIGNALKSLGKTTRGVPPILLQQAVTACVLKKCYFAAETWWPGKYKIIQTKRISNRVEAHIRLLERVVLTSARAILPVYCTTQASALFKEAHLRPPEIELNLAAQTYAARTARLDPRHPLRRRSTRIIRTGKASSRFSRIILALPRAESVNPIAQPPWQIHEDCSSTEKRIYGPQGRTKEQAAEEFEAFLPTIPRSDILVYSDGSKQEAADGATGAGSVTYQYNQQIDRKCFSIGRNAEVFDAEAIAALTGAKAALTLPSSRLATDLWVFLDNLEVATRLLAHSNGSSQAVFEEFIETARRWPLRSRLPHTRSGAIRIRWVPGHLNIPGNEEADKAAKEGAALPPPANATCTLASLKRIAKTEAKRASAQLWAITAPLSYKNLLIGYSQKKDLLHLKRAVVGQILAARSNHGDFAEYHTRFNHTDAHLTCSCGKNKSPLHFFFCRKGKANKTLYKGPHSDAIPWLLGTDRGALKLAKWLTDTKYYQDICPLYL